MLTIISTAFLGYSANGEKTTGKNSISLHDTLQK